METRQIRITFTRHHHRINRPPIVEYNCRIKTVSVWNGETEFLLSSFFYRLKVICFLSVGERGSFFRPVFY